jgi:hypothetical protein
VVAVHAAAFDYVALRDIKEGEKLFLDYGNGFEAAWQKHETNYKPISWME